MENPAPGGSSHPPASDIRIYLWIFYKRWPLILIPVILSLIGAWMYLETRTTTYEARALVRIEEKATPFSNYANAPQPATGGGKLPLGTAARLVKTQLCARLAQSVIEGINPGLSIPLPEILGSVSVETTDPDLLQISCQSAVPQRSVLIANAMAKAFVDNRTRQARAEATETRKFLDKQLYKTDKELVSLQDRMVRFKKSTGIVDVDEQVKAILASLTGYQDELTKAQVGSSEARSRLSQLATRLKEASPFEQVKVAQENPLVEALKKQLVEKQVDLVQLQSRYTDDYPEVQRAKDELEGLQRKLNSRLKQTVIAPRSVSNPLYDQIRGQLVNAQMNLVEMDARERAYSIVLQNERPRLTDLLDKKQKWDQLQELVNATRETYKGMLQRLQDAKVQEAAKLGDASVADLATTSTQLSVNRARTWAFGAILGLMAGAGLALLLEFLDDTVRTPEEIEEVAGAKELALVPFIREEHYREDLLRFMRSKSPAAEAMRTLRSNLKFVSAGNHGKTWMVTSCHPNEGKTFVSTSLGIALAQAGHRVVVVDADLRHPAIHKKFGLNNDIGLTSVLVGDVDLEQALQPTDVDNLSVLATGPLPPNPAELLDSSVMRSLIDRIKEVADVAVFDTAPASLVTDPAVLSTYLDGVLLVLETARVSRPTLKRVKETLEMANGRIVGTVINKITAKSSYYYYYYAYGDYYYRRYYSHYYGEDHASEKTSA